MINDKKPLRPRLSDEAIRRLIFAYFYTMLVVPILLILYTLYIVLMSKQIPLSEPPKPGATVYFLYGSKPMQVTQVKSQYGEYKATCYRSNGSLCDISIKQLSYTPAKGLLFSSLNPNGQPEKLAIMAGDSDMFDVIPDMIYSALEWFSESIGFVVDIIYNTLDSLMDFLNGE